MIYITLDSKVFSGALSLTLRSPKYLSAARFNVHLQKKNLRYAALIIKKQALWLIHTLNMTFSCTKWG